MNDTRSNIDEIKESNNISDYIEENTDNLFDINILNLASELWGIYITQIKDNTTNNISLISKLKEDVLENKLTGQETINIYEMQSLLDIIGIKKNINEIKLNINILIQKYPSNYLNIDSYNLSNFLDVVDSFRNNRIDDKLLVSAFQKLEVDGDGVIDINNLKTVNKNLNINLSDKELLDIVNFFNEGENNINAGLTFEEFTNLYYQG